MSSHQRPRGKATPIEDDDTSASSSRARQGSARQSEADLYGYRAQKAKVTLPPEITAWLNKEIPE